MARMGLIFHPDNGSLAFSDNAIGGDGRCMQRSIWADLLLFPVSFYEHWPYIFGQSAKGILS